VCGAGDRGNTGFALVLLKSQECSACWAQLQDAGRTCSTIAGSDLWASSWRGAES